jgi:hypothetical protein
MVLIYKLTTTESDEVYIGMTTTTLEVRNQKHKTSFMRWCEGKRDGYVSYFKLYQHGHQTIRIELVEETEDLTREGWHIQNTPNCVNMVVAGAYAAAGGEKQYVKKWHEEHPDQVKSAKQKHYEKVKAKELCECGMQYMIKHKQRHLASKGHNDRINNVPRETPDERKAKYNARRRVKVPCPHCNKEYTKASLTRHIKTQH